MKIDRIKYSKEFPSQLGNKWIGAEAVLDPGDNPEMAFAELVESVNAWAAGASIPLPGPEIVPAAPKVINRAHERLKDLLADCTTLEQLSSYMDDVKVANNPEVTRLYDKIGIELFQKTKK